MANSSRKNEYKVKFIKSGLSPREFRECLLCKVEELLKSLELEQITTLMNTTVEKVTKQVGLRVNESSPYNRDRRRTSTGFYRQEGILGGPKDTPRRRVDWERDNPGQGQQRADRAWKDQYHIQQHVFFNLPFIKGKLRCHFPEIIVKDEKRKKGFLFERSCQSERELTANEFCYVIHQITLDLGKELSVLRENMSNTIYSNKWRNTLKDVSDSCKKILMGRLVLDWAVDNDLMDRRSYEIWRDHVKVVIAFAALWVVADMMVCLLAKGWGPDPQLSVSGTEAITPAMWYAAMVGIPMVVSLLWRCALSHR